MSDLKHLFVPYELAVKLKEKGFDEACIAYYDKVDKNKLKPVPMTDEINSFHSNRYGKVMLSAPPYQQVVDWFREKHKLQINISRNMGGWAYSIIEFSRGNKCIVSKPNETEDYYLELNSAIKEALKLI